MAAAATSTSDKTVKQETKKTPAFGTAETSKPISCQPFVFGTPITQPSAFGAPVTQTSAFGAPVTQTSAFGAPVTQPSAFGAPVTQTSGFGVQVTQMFGFGAARPSYGPQRLEFNAFLDETCANMSDNETYDLLKALEMEVLKKINCSLKRKIRDLDNSVKKRNHTVSV